MRRTLFLFFTICTISGFCQKKQWSFGMEYGHFRQIGHSEQYESENDYYRGYSGPFSTMSTDILERNFVQFRIHRQLHPNWSVIVSHGYYKVNRNQKIIIEYNHVYHSRFDFRDNYTYILTNGRGNVVKGQYLLQCTPFPAYWWIQLGIHGGFTNERCRTTFDTYQEVHAEITNYVQTKKVVTELPIKDHRERSIAPTYGIELFSAPSYKFNFGAGYRTSITYRSFWFGYVDISTFHGYFFMQYNMGRSKQDLSPTE